jgi:hypothetical protein
MGTEERAGRTQAEFDVRLKAATEMLLGMEGVRAVGVVLDWEKDSGLPVGFLRGRGNLSLGDFLRMLQASQAFSQKLAAVVSEAMEGKDGKGHPDQRMGDGVAVDHGGGEGPAGKPDQAGGGSA